VPVAGDDVTIGGSVTPFAVVLDIATTGALASLTLGDGVNGNVTLGVGVNTLDVTGGTILLQGTGGSVINLSGGTITATNLGLAAGGVAGSGTLTVTNIVSPSSAGFLLASGGTLSVSGTIASGVILQIDAASASDLAILGNATAATAIAISSANQTLEIGPTATLTMSAPESITNGIIQLNGPGAALQMGANNLDIGASATLQGVGTVVASSISGSGAIVANGGTLLLDQNIVASAGPLFGINASSFLQLNGTVGTGNIFQFFSTTISTLGLVNDAGFSGVASGMNIGVGAPTTLIDIMGHTVTVSSTTGQNTTTGTITLSDGVTLNLSNLVATNWVALTTPDSAGTGTDVFLVTCYCRGTMILTDQGEVAVEELVIGDRVATISGVSKPIKWIGRRSYEGRFIAGSRLVLPIRISEGAIDDGIPARDLWISPEHALYFDGVLVPAVQLVNGTSIVQAEAVDELEYFHIELEAHDVIFAECAPAETYVDCDNRGMFQNGADFAALYPDDARPVWEFFAPRLEAGADELTAIRRSLSVRAEALGFEMSTDPDPHLVVDGQVVRAQSAEAGIYRFEIPAGNREIWLVSRSGVPAEAEGTSQDRRTLGIPVKRLVLRNADLRTEIGHAYPGLREGFYEGESHHRWTNGAARLPNELLRPYTGDMTIEVHLALASLRYALAPSVHAAA
jgi:hypothetical protein